ncbi:hypothetical protein F442_01527 [Phytophthora nicotianae P10297]|uniref:Uncharacterized protein n=1 Tax=Phytophthora nicotianae P10297 TaxID=1317064 RepID=W3A201_PHYNI|nr:hypothetical protein F442_01527 [Phytophthora nicotianae P10297]
MIGGHEKFGSLRLAPLLSMDPTRVPFLVDCWTVNEVVAKVADAASTSSVKHVQLESNLFKGFKALLNELYKPLSAV